MLQTTKVFNPEHHMPHETVSLTFHPLGVSHEVIIPTAFTAFLNQQCLLQTSASVYLVSSLSLHLSSPAFFSMLQPLLWLLSSFPLPKTSSLFSTQEDWRVVPFCAAPQLTSSEMSTLFCHWAWSAEQLKYVCQELEEPVAFLFLSNSF